MSSESDSEVFFDAEDTTPVRTSKTKGKTLKADEKIIDENVDIASPMPTSKGDKIGFPIIQVNNDDLKEVERKAKENEKRRKKVEELRNRMLTDDEKDEILEIPSEQSSLTSSVDGIFPSSNINIGANITQKPDEIKSIISLGKVGLILGEKDSISSDVKEPDTISSDSKHSAGETGVFCNDVFTENVIKGPEPDLVASTKGERVEPASRPIVPPRKKRKNKPPHAAQTPSDISESSDVADSQSSPSYSLDNFSKEFEGSLDLHNSTKGKQVVKPQVPASSDVPSFASSYTGDRHSREFECSLDLHSATRGQYVVKPQDREQNRAEGSGSYQICEVGEFNSSVQLSQSASSKRGSAKRDEDVPYVVRTRTDSGRPLTDQEILAQVKVLNLDTGEQIPLSLAEEHLPKCLNPLSLHIMRLTSEYVSNTALDKQRESDEESIDSKKAEPLDANKVWSITKEITKQFGKNIESRVQKLRVAVADKVHHTRHNEDDLSDDELPAESRSNVEIKISSKLKSVGRSEFEKIKVTQELSGEHTGAIWTMKFSCCGRLLATAGQDHDLRIWVLNGSFKYFDDMRQKFSAEGKASPTPSQESSPTGTLEAVKNLQLEKNDTKSTDGPFMEEPFCRYKGHTAELLDVSWSKNYFILSSSMDKTVRLWHISRQECLCCFQHIDFVTAIAFHPRDDRYFLSGSLDGKLRLWNIPDKKVTLWNELDGHTKLITAVNFCRDGKIAVVGSYDGRCIFYNTDQLKYYTQIHVRSSRGKNKVGRKISGIEAMPGEDKILVTSNDSRIRLYDLRDLSLSCKYKGYVNLSSQIKASFSHDGRYIISGSENQYIYIWKSFHDYAKFSRRDRNDYWERIKAHSAVVTSAVFAPNPSLILKQLEQEENNTTEDAEIGATNCYVMVSADFSGTIKVFLHKSKPGTTNSS